MGLAAILAENGNVEATDDVINHVASVPSRRRAAAHVNTGVSRRVSSTHGHPSSLQLLAPSLYATRGAVCIEPVDDEHQGREAQAIETSRNV